MISDITQASQALAAMMAGKKTIAITGAGLSTDSGLPDYRGKGSTEQPSVYFDDFASDPVWRRWVWQRNQETWRAVDALVPTAGHCALARLEKAGLVFGVATQNVDNLHQKAGARRVAELHGSFTRVTCISCGTEFPRERIDTDLRRLNPNLTEDPDPRHAAILAGADREAAQASTFVVPPCPRCGGILKPAVVFFGESLPGQAMQDSLDMAREADVALVIGTSLVVMTGMFVVREALATGSTLAIINRGRTQADPLADLRIEGGASEVLQRTAELLLGIES